MKTIVNNVINELIIKKSKFITFLFPIMNEQEAEKKLEELRQEYKHANHYCYAYILDESMRQSDDGEPSGTAGLPMLEVLKKEECNRILAVVVRYFGGIKLGASGLIRAYSKSVKEAIKMAQITHLELGQEFNIFFSYDDLKKVDYQLKNTMILKKEYKDEVIYTIWIPIAKQEESILDSLSVRTIANGNTSYQEMI